MKTRAQEWPKWKLEAKVKQLEQQLIGFISRMLNPPKYPTYGRNHKGQVIKLPHHVPSPDPAKRIRKLEAQIAHFKQLIASINNAED